MNTFILLCALATTSPGMVCRVVDTNLKPIDDYVLVAPDANKAFQVKPLPPLPSDEPQMAPNSRRVGDANKKRSFR
jgi:hypothetical protein